MFLSFTHLSSVTLTMTFREKTAQGVRLFMCLSVFDDEYSVLKTFEASEVLVRFLGLVV